MTDRLTPEARSRLMSRVRCADTKPEIAVRRLLHSLGFRFRLHRRDLPGCPDIVLPRHRKIVFVHGCFWHSHPGCRRASRPKDHREFWDKKLAGNTERDEKSLRALEAAGWKVLIIWECETRNAAGLRERIRGFLGLQPEY